ncbi:MAG: CPBP family intramembrane metalloprotease [candidate division KSB1 bacterium]|nr:CPBP family intramembrane metalloprotease [candidate division KSB1 bacterium]MDZ7319148.1 CPBP family intramembrane metalloprotease [candidate division KSB1 bacterium]MDZ7341381.1 CPBP family intramembrane metalloprotease [candidate division KSB1 bacterium]
MNTEGTPIYPQVKEVFVILLITIIVTFVVAALVALVGARTELFLLEGLVIIPALLYLVIKRYPIQTVFRLRRVSFNVLGISAIIGMAFTIVTDEIDRLIQLVLPMPEPIRQMLEASLKINSISDLIIIAFSAVFLAAVVEEFLFRGFVQTSFENHFDVTKAVMSTALTFAFFHFNIWWSIQILIMGVILGVLAWKANSVYPAIVVHFINNAMALMSTNLTPTQMGWYYYKDHVRLPILIAAVLTTIYGIRLYYHFCDTRSSTS